MILEESEKKISEKMEMLVMERNIYILKCKL